MSARPLLVTDCDEVLLHMVSHFGAWLGELHDLDFAPHEGFAMRRRDTAELLPREESWRLLGVFFDSAMDRQTLVPHAADVLARLSDIADIVVLTNLEDHRRDHRIAQLARFGIAHRVETNQGGKGGPLRRLLDEYAPSVAVFVDDLAVHHESAAKHAPEIWRLHMVAEPGLAPLVPAAPHAHARIDDWLAAESWIGERFGSGIATAA